MCTDAQSLVPGGLSDEENDAIYELMGELFIEAAELPTRKSQHYSHAVPWEVAWKVGMLETDLKDGIPTNHRHWLMLASIRADLET